MENESKSIDHDATLYDECDECDECVTPHRIVRGEWRVRARVCCLCLNRTPNGERVFVRLILI